MNHVKGVSCNRRWVISTSQQLASAYIVKLGNNGGWWIRKCLFKFAPKIEANDYLKIRQLTLGMIGTGRIL